MKKISIAIAFCALFVGCSQSESPKQVNVEPANTIQAKPAKSHNYALRDGFEYGYEKALSADDINKGQGAPALIMAKYAGQRDGKYQIYIIDKIYNGGVTVAECSNPCEFMKIMSFYQGAFVTAERIRAAPGIIGWMILQDAINGELEPHIGEKKGRPVSFWFDEKKGLIVTPLTGKP